MKKEFINEKKVGIVTQIILLILLGLIFFSSIKGYMGLNFVLSLVLVVISFRIYKKYKRTPFKLIIEEASLLFKNKADELILKTDLEKVQMYVDDYDYIELVVDDVKYYFHFGMKTKNFKQDLNIAYKKKEKKTGIFMDFLSILFD
jgi:hypothetical protein